MPTYLYGTLLAGQYKTPAIYVEVQSLFTNTGSVDAYRGAGRPEATFVVERLVETAAREIGMDPTDLRRRNFIQPGDFPYETPVALTYDTGDYEASLDKALAHANYAAFAERKAASEAMELKRGIGFSCYIEACGLAPSQVALSLGAGVGLFEVGEVRVDVTGSVTVVTGSHSHGQSHETTFAQIISEKLGVPFENVTVLHGDTGRSDYALGTYGSRSLAVGGSAIVKATDKIIAKGKKIAAHMLEANAEQVEFEDGSFNVRDSNQSLTFGEVAFAAYVPANYPLDELEPGLSEKAFYDPPNFTYPAGAHVCEVEVDPETGVVEIVQFVAVDDFGNVVNPMIVEGQVHGGLAQGIGQALLEHGIYDDTGQLLTGSYMDYTMPRADDLPSFVVDTTTTALHPQPARREGLRGSWRHRLHRSGDQRRHRRPRRGQHRHAGDTGNRLAHGKGGIAMYDFHYHKPASLAEAAELMANAEDGAYLSGGMTLIPTLKQRLASPSDVIDLAGIDGLNSIGMEGSRMKVGAMTRHADVAANTAIPALAALAGQIGDAHVRNRGTLGGSIANSDPAADYPAAVLALDATVHTNKRRIAGSEFFTGLFETALEEQRDRQVCRLPRAGQRRLREVPQPRVALCRGRRDGGALRRRRLCRRNGRRPLRLPAPRRWRKRWPPTSARTSQRASTWTPPTSTPTCTPPPNTERISLGCSPSGRWRG